MIPDLHTLHWLALAAGFLIAAGIAARCGGKGPHNNGDLTWNE